MEHHQSPQGLQTLIVLLALVAIIMVTAFYLSFIKKRKAEHHSGH